MRLPGETMIMLRRALLLLTFTVFLLFLITLYLAVNQEVDFAQADRVTTLPDLPHALELPFRHYAGYLTPANNTNIFYWFFESQGEPTDPVVVFLNGGPGCSSLLGAFGEVGPISISVNGRLALNPFSWNTRAHLLFLESPKGVGFSHISTQKQYDTDDFRAAQLNFSVLRSFFEKFPHLLANSFYLTGEAYAGRYIALLASLILEHSFPPKFKGIALGNPYLLESADTAHSSQLEFIKLHGIARYSPEPIPNATRAWLYNIHRQCRDDYFPLSFGYFLNYTNFHSTVPQRNLPNCWVDSSLSWWLNKATVQQAIHAKTASTAQQPIRWEPCNQNKYLFNFIQLGEKELNLKHRFRLFNGAIKVLLFSGDADFYNNLVRVKWFVDDLNLELLSKNEPLYFEGRQAGLVYRYKGNFTFVHLFNAGGMAPADQPGPTLKMLHKFLLDEHK